MSIERFEGEYRFLSNFALAPVTVRVGDHDIRVPTVEHGYQALKTLDMNQRYAICQAPTPSRAKGMGRHVDLRPDWELVKVQLMRQLLEQKFEIPELRQKLAGTVGLFLTEGNYWHDNFWGVCYCARCREQEKAGFNQLGILLMEIRRKVVGL